MRVPRKPLRLSLVEAASRQTHAAIDAIQDGQFDIAVTLACAAEGMLKTRAKKIPSIFQLALALRGEHEHRGDKTLSEKELISIVNCERDWLKHGGPPSMEIDCFAATASIVRAISKFEQPSPRMKTFLLWMNKNIDRL